MTEYRFTVTTNRFDSRDFTVTRGRLVRVGDQYGDAWSSYFDGSTLVGFYDEGWDGRRPIDGLDPVAEEDSRRALTAFNHQQYPIHQTHDWRVHHGALDRVARRIVNEVSTSVRIAWDSEFICIGLDRGRDLYVLAWGGDKDNALRDEIEALNYGDIYEVECEDYDPVSQTWQPADSYGERWYGERQAEHEFARAFDLDAFPSELFVTATD